MKTKMKNKMKRKTKMKIKMNVRFCFDFFFSFSFLFLLMLSKNSCSFVNSTWPRGAIDSQLSLDCPRSAIAFSFANFALGLAVPQMVNSLLIGLEVPQHLEMWHPASFEYAEFNDTFYSFRFRPEIPFLGRFALKYQNCQFKVKLDTWTYSKTPNSMVVSTFSVQTGNTLFGEIWSKKSKFSV